MVYNFFYHSLFDKFDMFQNDLPKNIIHGMYDENCLGVFKQICHGTKINCHGAKNKFAMIENKSKIPRILQ